MKTIYIDFDETFLSNDSMFTEMVEVAKKYENKVSFIIDIKEVNEKKDIMAKLDLPLNIDYIGEDANSQKHSQIRIFYNDGGQFDWQQEYENEEVLVVNKWKDVEDIIDFYLQYDYKTLEKIR